MATIKSFTDLEQSNKLADILPLESADLKWFFWMEDPTASKSPSFGYNKNVAESYKNIDAIYLPCWSLAALLSVLYYPSLENISNKWSCASCDKDGNRWILGEKASNPIDACYKTILKLHELKML